MEFQEATRHDTGAELVPAVEKSDQGYVVGTVFARVGEHKVRAEVRSGIPPMLSWARVCVWSPSALMWNEMHALPKVKTPRFERGRQIDPALFGPDISELMSAARAILL